YSVFLFLYRCFFFFIFYYFFCCFYFLFLFFFFNDPATTEIYTLSLHDALPICHARLRYFVAGGAGFMLAAAFVRMLPESTHVPQDRKSTRLNSSHLGISYAVFCLKKKKKKKKKNNQNTKLTKSKQHNLASNIPN